ncbi:O-antigen ligase family protein [Lysobacter sp. GCM10012299]|uniref:O-antigen ligase family protein n=1 Tax=Lysobacter sp. GCM10012299 TaxID=3317333 RepID=UPI003605B4C1
MRPVIKLRHLLYLVLFCVPWAAGIELPVVGNSLKLAFAVLLGGYALVALAGRSRPSVPGIGWWAGALAAWSLVSCFWAISPEDALTKAVSLAQCALLLILLRTLLSSSSYTMNACLALIAGGLVTLALTLNQFGASEHLGDYRYFPEGFDPNELAVSFSTLAMLSFAIATVHESRISRLFCWLIGIGLLVGTLFTGSRTGLIVIGVGILTHLAIALRGAKVSVIVGVAVGLFALVAVIANILPEETIARLSSIEGEVQGGTLNQRSSLWQVGINSFLNHPFFGVGSGSFPRISERDYGIAFVAHNTFISVLAELGVIGLLLLLAAVTSCFRTFFVERQTLVMLPAVLCLLVGALGLTWEHRPIFWVVLALPCLVVARRRFG